ncbi:methyltransferase domain-containing protein [Ramlibacter ginsenosidimutans]|uniref:Methyltransferase domain-containing protein n=1 Tax=Ramlibacter ginsenosidimutans TaxID=502333 RepID=A0A934WLH3_9BURK|nr:methyltransferase domain-containing protein [Ramlibacter ginsenosidimutans]MBK6005102.1 methyltransferase domain-containing protein [Ramlibacter ginsenosidimutans]
MASERPPTIDPVAAARWAQAAPAASPWLHEEVGRRMEERLEWIKRAPPDWADWEAVRGGLAAHARIVRRYPQARVHVVEPQPRLEAVAQECLAGSWWKRLTRGDQPDFGPLPEGGVQMLWSNMHLHMVADPQALMQQWHQSLAVDGFLMFSCLGPDTVRELRTLYAELGWPPPTHEFTDMHDWGDMLVHTGFAEPVMDMERIALSFATPERLLAELRELGANLHPARFPALRGAGWKETLLRALDTHLRTGPDGQLALSFEIVYGHALKPTPRAKVGEQTAVSVADMRSMLRGGRK